MKKIIYTLLTILIFACSSDNENNDVTNSQYFFEIKFGGEVHRIQGNNSELFKTGTNRCVASLQQGYQVIQFILNDITSTDFISKQPLIIFLVVSNPKIGDNNGAIQFYSTPFLDKYAQDIKTNFLGNNFVENTQMNAIEAIQLGVVGNVTNIKLTDLGTSPSNLISFNGGNMKGSYEGILHFIQNGWTTSDTNHDVAVPIKITFSAVRLN